MTPKTKASTVGASRALATIATIPHANERLAQLDPGGTRRLASTHSSSGGSPIGNAWTCFVHSSPSHQRACRPPIGSEYHPGATGAGAPLNAWIDIASPPSLQATSSWRTMPPVVDPPKGCRQGGGHRVPDLVIEIG